MKKILSIIVVGLLVLMGSALYAQQGNNASASGISIMNTPLQIRYSNNSPPSTPDINGPVKGKHGVNYNFTFTSTDPDGDKVFYYIEWGDGCPSIVWLGPFPSGQTITANHTYARGTWNISCQAMDIHNATSDWGFLKVTMPFSLTLPSNGLLERLLARFPNAFPILRHLLGY